MKKVLIPTDFSRNAWDAIVYTADMLEDHPCEIYLLNVYDYSDYATDNIMVPQLDDRLYDTLKLNSEKGLEQIMQRLSFRDLSENHQYISISRQNNLVDAIKDIVELKDIELVVMGTKGDTDALNKTFGSNTVLVMEKVRSCPVLAIPPETTYQPISEIVFPTSFKTHFKMRELAYLIDIAKIVRASISVIHVIKEEELDDEQLNYKNLLEECFEGVDYSFHMLENTHIHEATDLFVQIRNSGMIAFINKKHTLFSYLFTKPLVKELGMHSKVPVLALHDFRN